MASHEERRYAVRARWLFDGTALLDEAANPMVVIEDGRISDVDTSGAPPSDDLPVLDLDEATLLPGLIDAHTHLVFDATEQVVPHVQAATEQALLAHMRQAARAMLACGITTARDLGDRDYLSLTIRAETARRPTPVRPSSRPVHRSPPPADTAGSWAARLTTPTRSPPPCTTTPSTASTSSRSWPPAGA